MYPPQQTAPQPAAKTNESGARVIYQSPDFDKNDTQVPFLVELDDYAELDGGIEGEDYFKIGNLFYSVKYPDKTERYTKAQFDYIKNYVTKVHSLCYKENVTLDELAEYIDVVSFIDYFLIQEIVIQPDINYKSVYMYKAVDGKMKMQLFNAKENSYVPQVMVLATAGSPKIRGNANAALVTSLEKTINSEEDVVDRIGLLNSVGEAYYDCKIPDLATVKGVEEGDIIAYELDSKNRITAINIIVDYNKVNSRSSVLRTDTDVTNLTSPNRSYDATFRVRFGNVYAKEGNVITISDTLEDNLARSEVESFTASTSMIYKVEQE